MCVTSNLTSQISHNLRILGGTWWCGFYILFQKKAKHNNNNNNNSNNNNMRLTRELCTMDFK